MRLLPIAKLQARISISVTVRSNQINAIASFNSWGLIKLCDLSLIKCGAVIYYLVFPKMSIVWLVPEQSALVSPIMLGYCTAGEFTNDKQ